MPRKPRFVTLQVPHLMVHVQHQVLATLRKIPERDLASQFPVRRTATAHRVAAGTEWIIVHAHVRILSRPFQREKPLRKTSLSVSRRIAGREPLRTCVTSGTEPRQVRAFDSAFGGVQEWMYSRRSRRQDVHS